MKLYKKKKKKYKEISILEIKPSQLAVVTFCHNSKYLGAIVQRVEVHLSWLGTNRFWKDYFNSSLETTTRVKILKPGTKLVV